MITFFDDYHSVVVPQNVNGIALVDYSVPAVHRFSHSGLEFEFPSMPESDDASDVYLKAMGIQPGDVVLDVGAYAGASTYFFSKAVGPEGLVVAFEPDEINFPFLQRNIARHNLTNVKAYKMGLWNKSTTLAFQAEGTMGSTVADFVARQSNVTTIEVVSLAAAAELCGERGE